MGLSLAQMQAVSELARYLYDFLPGSSAWQGTYTFAQAASQCRVGGLSSGGSELPALTRLLEDTLVGISGAFCSLVEFKYCSKKGNPLTRFEIETLNEDGGWDGRVRDNPHLSSSCVVHQHICDAPDDEKERAFAGTWLSELDAWCPPCSRHPGAFSPRGYGLVHHDPLEFRRLPEVPGESE